MKMKTNKKKNMKIFIQFVLIMLAGRVQAYIPSSRMILDKVVENSLKTPLYVEQEVKLASAQGIVHLREQWLYESENTIRVIVKGEKELQDQIHFQIHYSDLQRSSTITGLSQTSRLTHPLFEKVFFIKSTENLMRFLIQHEIVTNEILNSQIFKKIPGNSGFQYQPESFVRLGRIGGRVAYVMGPPPEKERLMPGFWIEQDLFNILKLRNMQGEEFRVDKLASFNRGIKWFKEIQLSWGAPSVTAQIQTSTVKTVDSNLKQIFQKKFDKRNPEFEKHFGKNIIEEFYSRFR